MRLDLHLVKSGLASSRSKAVHLIKAGKVTVNGAVASKQSKEVKPGDAVALLEPFAYASRAGYKLEALADAAGLDPSGVEALDVGCSTGGFTDFLLRRGAARVVAVDIAAEILDASLRADPRVEFHGGVDAADPAAMDRAAAGRAFPLVTMDVTGVPLSSLLPVAARHLAPGGRVAALFKPQYEGGGGARDEAQAREAAAPFERWLEGRFCVLASVVPAIRGGAKWRGGAEVMYLLAPTDGPLAPKDGDIGKP